MTDGDPFFKAGLRAASPLSTSQAGEKLYESLVGHARYLFELRDHGIELGVATQIFKNEDLLAPRRFDRRLNASRPSRGLAIQSAEEMRKHFEGGGAW